MFLSLESGRLKLIAATAEMLERYIANKAFFENLIGADCPDNWPVEKDIYPLYAEMLKIDNSLSGWLNWLIIEKNKKILIGDTGFKGKPDSDGAVEIGYSIIPEFRNRGYASEAVRLLICYAFQFPDIKSVIAETDSRNLYSINILRKVNMYCYDSIINEKSEILKWRLSRDEFIA
jgi:[ribosomal protein S5]-alanine N-acetyltransferase